MDSIPRTFNATFFNSGKLILIAREAYRRIPATVHEHDPDKHDAVVAILFSAAAIEAFIADISVLFLRIPTKHAKLQTLAKVLVTAEDSKATVRLKFQMAKAILGGETYDQSVAPWQDFHLLFKLRDAIVHAKPEDVTDKPNRLVAGLAAMQLCKPPSATVAESWLGQVSTRAVARWACNCGVDMSNSLFDSVPREDIEAEPTFVFLRSWWQKLD
jgi:hypothetical protein